MNIFDPIGYQKQNVGEFEKNPVHDQWNLLLNGTRIGSTTYVHLRTAEIDLKERHLGYAARQKPWPVGYEVVKVN